MRKRVAVQRFYRLGIPKKQNLLEKLKLELIGV